MKLQCGKYRLDLTHPRVMGIVNVTPDSFSDGGQFDSAERAIEYALMLVEEGADILDIGGESSRPGAEPVALDEELLRVIPVVERLAGKIGVPISVDTYKPEVMRAAIAAGADVINDIRALQESGALDVVAASNVGVCLMHMQGTPQTMQQDPRYEDVTAEVRNFLEARARAVVATGIARERIMLDPGFGFGKRSEHNIALLRHLASLCALGYPVLVGLSRKSVLGHLTGSSIGQRLPASIAAAIISAMKGAKILRVHDVAATVEALKIAAAAEGV